MGENEYFFMDQTGFLVRSCLQVTLVIKFLRPPLTRWGLKNDEAAEIPLLFPR